MFSNNEKEIDNKMIYILKNDIFMCV